MLGRLRLRRCATTGDAPGNIKDAWMVRAKDCQGPWINRGFSIAQVICKIVVHPGKGTGGIGCKMCSTGISGQVVLDADLAPLSIVIAHQAIISLVVLLQPERGRVPVFRLGILIIERDVM